MTKELEPLVSISHIQLITGCNFITAERMQRIIERKAQERYKRTCKPHIVARTFRGDSKPSFWQALCDCGWIVGEDGTPNLNEFTHVDNFCGNCGAEVIVDD